MVFTRGTLMTRKGERLLIAKLYGGLWKLGEMCLVSPRFLELRSVLSKGHRCSLNCFDAHW